MKAKREQLTELEQGLYHVNQKLTEALATLDLLEYAMENMQEEAMTSTDQLDYVLRGAKRNLSQALDDNFEVKYKIEEWMKETA